MRLLLFILVLAGILTLFLGVDYYAFTGLRSILSPAEPRWRKVAYGIYALTTLVTLSGIGLLLAFFLTRNPKLYLPGSYLLSWAMAFFLGKAIWGLFLVLGDSFNGINQLLATQEAATSLSRRRFVSQVGLSIASMPFLSLVYGIIKGKYDYRVHRLTFAHPDLPAAFDGFTLVQLSDIHSGSFDDERAVQRGVEMAMQQQPDLIVFTGDLINREVGEFDRWRKVFGQLDAPYGLFSTLGNHDYPEHLSDRGAYQAHMQALRDHHEAIGFRLLNNENVRLERNGEFLSLIGVENWGEPPFPQKGDLDQALRGTEDAPFRLLLSHDPTHWDRRVRPHRLPVHLTLSGHTHGMQFGVETKGFKWSPVKYRYPRWAGRYDQDGQTLYVNRGFGFIGFSGRVGIWPEVTHITLKKGPANPPIMG